MNVPLPFIIGSPRSGTTMLRAMFDSHSDMSIPPESYFIVGLRGRVPDGPTFDVGAFESALRSHKWFQLWGMQHEASIALREATPTTYADAIRIVYQTYAEIRGKNRYGDKTPKYALSVPVLADLFPESNFIHIIRDGRDAALSLMDVRFGQDHVRDAARLWRDRVRAARSAGRAVGAARYREVRYEELVANPSGCLEKLCSFVDLRFEPQMLAYHKRVKEIPIPRGPRGLYRPDNQVHVAQPPTPGVRDWRTQMSSKDLAIFEAEAGPLLSELGYPRGLRRVPAIDSVRARAAVGMASARAAVGSARKKLRVAG